MYSSLRNAAFGALALASQTNAINILMGNDDGFGSANLRETYRFLKESGHNVVVVAPADFQSGKGGTSVFAESNVLEQDSQYGLIPAGAPAVGQDPNDQNIWYYNGTPAATLFVALDYVLPNFTDFSEPDLVVAGPNYGTNLGPFLYTLSGTLGYTYSAVGRNYPAIAFSGGNGEQRSYQWINQTTASGYPDPATIQGKLAANVVNTLVKNTKPGDRLMPLGYGLNVNTPEISSFEDDSCIDPPFFQSRMTGGAEWDIAVQDPDTGTFSYGSIYPPGGNQCLTGSCELPGESEVLDAGCMASATVFGVDYTAPIGPEQDSIRSRLQPLVSYEDGSKPEHQGGWWWKQHGWKHHGWKKHGPPSHKRARYLL